MLQIFDGFLEVNRYTALGKWLCTWKGHRYCSGLVRPTHGKRACWSRITLLRQPEGTEGDQTDLVPNSQP